MGVKTIAGTVLKILKRCFKPAIAIFSGVVMFAFAAGRCYERAYMIANENWVKRGAARP